MIRFAKPTNNAVKCTSVLTDEAVLLILLRSEQLSAGGEHLPEVHLASWLPRPPGLEGPGYARYPRGTEGGLVAPLPRLIRGVPLQAQPHVEAVRSVGLPLFPLCDVLYIFSFIRLQGAAAIMVNVLLVIIVVAAWGCETLEEVLGLVVMHGGEPPLAPGGHLTHGHGVRPPQLRGEVLVAVPRVGVVLPALDTF